MKIIRKLLKYLLIILLVIFVGFSIYISYQVGSSVTHLSNAKDTKANIESYWDAVGFNNKEFIKEYKVKEDKLKSSYFDHQISIAKIDTRKNSKGTVIMVHGLGGTKETVYPIAQLFLDLGYNVVAYDQRNSGDNTADTNTFGIKESKDLIDVINNVQEGQINGDKLFVWGESFGGATVGIASDKIGQKVDGMILDSPMSNGLTISEMFMQDIVDETGLPMQYFIQLGDWNLRMKYGFSFSESKVAKYISNSEIPLLVIHSKEDQVIPYEMGKEIYEASPAKNKKFLSVDQGEHVHLYFEQPELYCKHIENFMDQINK